MQFIDRIPLPFLVVISIMMLGAPFVPEPHFVEKTRMLLAGSLTKPIDIFDLFWHLLPTIMLAVKVFRQKARQSR